LSFSAAIEMLYDTFKAVVIPDKAPEKTRTFPHIRYNKNPDTKKRPTIAAYKIKKLPHGLQ
jgi:hypothetical protein